MAMMFREARTRNRSQDLPAIMPAQDKSLLTEVRAEKNRMMEELLLFTYIFAGFAGVLAILLIFILVKYGAKGNKKILNALKYFTACTMAIDILYFAIDWVALRQGERIIFPVLRVADILAFVFQVYFWTEYMREKSALPIKEKLEKITRAATAVCLLLSIICYGVLMDGYYTTEDGAERLISVMMEVAITLLLMCGTVENLRKCLPGIPLVREKWTVTLISAVITINGAWNTALVLFIMAGQLETIIEAFADFTPILLLLTNIGVIIVLYKEYFLSMIGSHAEEPPQDMDRKFSEISNQYHLTPREEEIMKLAYRGLTNPEIAEQLFISKFTVKGHMHNIFEKLGISTRKELIHFINNENSPGGLL